MLSVEYGISPIDLMESPPGVVEAMLHYIEAKQKAEKRQDRTANWRSRLRRA